LFSCLIISLSGCSNAIVSNNNLIQVGIKTFSNNQQALEIINKNQKNISSITQLISSENFAENIQSLISSLNPAEVESIYNTLISNAEAQQLGYSVADDFVQAKLNEKSKPDTVAKISSDETAKLKSLLKNGDVILCGNNKSFVHAMLYIGNNQVIHSLATKVAPPRKFLGVVKQTLDEYFALSERDTFVVLRYRNVNAQDVQRSIDYASQQIGKNYDSLFLLDSDTRFYCTELVYQSLRRMSNPPRVLPHKEKIGWTLVTVQDFMDSPDFDTVWTKNYKRPPVGVIHNYSR